MANPRDRALELIEEGIVSAEDMVTMCVKYMSVDDVEDMLDCNELSDRFMEDEEEDYEDDGHLAGSRSGQTSENAMSEAPKMFVIQTSTEEVSVTAMDFLDAVQTWVQWGGHPTDILAIEEHENRTTETVH